MNNNTPGILISSTVTQVLKPTIVNEMNFGYTHNRWGFRAGPETAVGSDFDYTKLYAANLGITAPRLQPFDEYSDPPALAGFGGPQIDEWPYAPRFSTSGGNRANLAGYMTANGNLPLPRLNMSARATWADDLSMTKGRHNIKMGLSLEFNHKTEPGSADYVGNYNFGNDANNPLNTGYGYANMLLGAFSTYTELTDRVDKAVRHWQNDVYIQDNWRATPRLTLDYGVRLQHSGSDYEVNNNHTGFFTDQWNASKAARVYTLVCTTGVPGNQACPAASQKTIDPANPGVFFPSAFNGNIVPGTGNQINGVSTDGISGAKAGTYFKFPFLVAAPRVGMAWNVTGDGKTALRASCGNLLQLPAIDRDGWLQLRRWLPRLVQQSDSMGDVRRHCGGRKRVERRATGAVASQRERWRLRPAARQVLQHERRVPAGHRLQHSRRDCLRGQLRVRERTDGRHQSTAAQRLCRSGKSREQRAAERQLAATEVQSIPRYGISDAVLRESEPGVAATTTRCSSTCSGVCRTGCRPASPTPMHTVTATARRAVTPQILATTRTPMRSAARRRSRRATGVRRPRTAGTT